MRASPLIDSRMPELRALCARFGVARLRLFGSGATGEFDPATSDLDFLVELGPAEEMSRFQQFMGLKLALQELFGRPVDLISARAVRGIAFRSSIEGSSIDLYAA